MSAVKLLIKIVKLNIGEHIKGGGRQLFKERILFVAGEGVKEYGSRDQLSNIIYS